MKRFEKGNAAALRIAGGQKRRVLLHSTAYSVRSYGTRPHAYSLTHKVTHHHSRPCASATKNGHIKIQNNHVTEATRATSLRIHQRRWQRWRLQYFTIVFWWWRGIWLRSFASLGSIFRRRCRSKQCKSIRRRWWILRCLSNLRLFYWRRWIQHFALIGRRRWWCNSCCVEYEYLWRRHYSSRLSQHFSWLWRRRL